jgi:hypothetical protein
MKLKKSALFLAIISLCGCNVNPPDNLNFTSATTAQTTTALSETVTTTVKNDANSDLAGGFASMFSAYIDEAELKEKNDKAHTLFADITLIMTKLIVADKFHKDFKGIYTGTVTPGEISTFEISENATLNNPEDLQQILNEGLCFHSGLSGQTRTFTYIAELGSDGFPVYAYYSEGGVVGSYPDKNSGEETRSIAEIYADVFVPFTAHQPYDTEGRVIRVYAPPGSDIVTLIKTYADIPEGFVVE